MELSGRLLSRRAFLGVVGVAACPVARAETSAISASRLRTRLEAELEAVGRWAKESGGRLGAAFIDVGTSAELAGYAADVAENPASNQKLVTAGAALRYLGPSHVFSTGLYGRVENGRVQELVLRGEGDPSLRSGDLLTLARALAERGVTAVRDVLVDQSAFDDEFVPPGFEQQPDEWAAFRAPVSAVAVDRNTVLVSLAPGAPGAPARVGFEPAGFVEARGRIQTGVRGARSTPRIALVPNGQKLAARLSGTIALGSEPLRYRQRVDDPRWLAGHALKNSLLDTGIAVSGTVRLGGSAERAELAVHRSHTLAELLFELGKASDNFYAEMVLKALGAVIRGRPGSSRAGAELATAWLREMGAWDAGMRISNGSGLFDANRASPRALARLLVAMYRDPKLSLPFLAQLAVGGVDGTLRARFAKLAQRRALLAKTGTLRDVVALSGYVVGPEGASPVAFSLLVNGVAGRTVAARQRMDSVVELVASELWTAPGG